MRTAFLLLVFTATALQGWAQNAENRQISFRDEKRTARFGLETVQQCIWL